MDIKHSFLYQWKTWKSDSPAPKWVLINWPKYPKCPKIAQIVCQDQKFGILMKKDSLSLRSPWIKPHTDLQRLNELRAEFRMAKTAKSAATVFPLSPFHNSFWIMNMSRKKITAICA